MAVSGDIEQFIEQNRHLSDVVESFRTVSESDKHWTSRRAFIFRNINDYEDPHRNHLLALSMVWANNVFLGCQYSQDLLEKVKDMAEGIVVEDAPVFKTRDEIIKDQQKVDFLIIFCSLTTSCYILLLTQEDYGHSIVATEITPVMCCSPLMILTKDEPKKKDKQKNFAS